MVIRGPGWPSYDRGWPVPAFSARVEKLRYMHRNPMKRGLVNSPEQWRWSSCRFYLLEEVGAVGVNVGWTEISLQNRVA